MRQTQVLPASDPESIRLAAEIIRGGGLVPSRPKRYMGSARTR